MSNDDREFMRNYKTNSPDLLKAYADFSGAVFAEEGREIPKKYRELMALAVAVWLVAEIATGSGEVGSTISRRMRRA